MVRGKRTTRATRAKSITPLNSIIVDSSEHLVPSKSPEITPRTSFLESFPNSECLPHAESFPFTESLSRGDTPLPLPLQSTEDNRDSEDKRITWSLAMVETLVEYVYRAFKKGRLSDNGMKKELWIEAAIEVNKVCQGKEVFWDKVKNKWGSDIKEKWKHWVLLSEMSGFGWNEEIQKYEAYEYVWDNLNKAHPRITWHKTHVMYCREMLSEILHESQATGRGALSGYGPREGALKGHLVIDPRLTDLDSEVPTSVRSSPFPQIKPKTPYNRSKKRARVDMSDEEEEEAPASKRPTVKKDKDKVDVGSAISSLSEELKRSREIKESYKSVPQQAIHLLEVIYGERLDLMEFIQGCIFFKDEGNAGIFIAIENAEKRDRWLEINLGVELKIM